MTKKQSSTIDYSFEQQLVGQSPELNSVVWAAKITAASDVTVLMQGESGCGKEIFAQAIHYESPRKNSPLITVNCAAIPENLAESMLFGHVKGAFTGATSDQQGYIQNAHNGTLFLDEIGELSLSIQAKLLRFIESSECQKIGSSRVEQANVRLLVATNRNLRKEVKRGTFREDLFYRLNIVPLEIPALRQRTGDVKLLLKHFSKALAKQYSIKAPSYSAAALKCLVAYSWPGNVRELRNLCERMSILMAGKNIEVSNLPNEIRQPVSELADSVVLLPESGVSLEKVEVDLIKQALEKTLGNQTKAARLLGLTRDTLIYRMRKYALS